MWLQMILNTQNNTSTLYSHYTAIVHRDPVTAPVNIQVKTPKAEID